MVAVPSWCSDPLRNTRRVKEPPLSNCQKINRIWDIPYEHVTEERLTEWPPEFLSRPRRTPRTIPDFLAPDAPANRLDIIRGLGEQGAVATETRALPNKEMQLTAKGRSRKCYVLQGCALPRGLFRLAAGGYACSNSRGLAAADRQVR